VAELETVRRVIRAAVAALESQRRRIDDLNVYPVPDGDTGTNLTMTVRAIAEAVAGSRAADRLSLARETARAALMGARGNSGVILSQMVRGAADALAQARTIDAHAVAAALRAASHAAYGAVRNPVEGTMLTVVRELAEEAERLAHERPQLTPMLRALVRRGEEALARTPDQLEALRAAGVVDAGGAGIVELLRGIAAAVAGEALPEPSADDALEPGIEALHAEPSRYRYCTTFVVLGDELDLQTVERQLEPLGDSLLVVGDPEALKVHVHTDDPGGALRIGTQHGSLANVEVNDMHRQTVEREQRLERRLAVEPKRCEVVAIVTGEGNRHLFADLGAGALVDGGATMNPSTESILAAIETAAAEEAVVLPNNPNVRMAAEQAAEEATKRVRVVPTESIPAGLAALVAYDPARSAADNAEVMAAAAEEIATGAVALASRDARLNGVAVTQGEYVGLVGRDAVTAGPDFAAVVDVVIEELLSEPKDVLTLLRGQEAPVLDEIVAHLTQRHPGLEVDVHDGGQAHYALLVSAE
jgi:hypothetical protein